MRMRFTFTLKTLMVVLAAAAGLAWWCRLDLQQRRQEQALRLLAESPRTYEADSNPVAVVRCVNLLRSLGKRRAIETLTAYSESAEWEDDANRILVVLPLLFPAAESRRPPPSTIFDGVVQVEDDLPFQIHLVSSVGSTHHTTVVYPTGVRLNSPDHLRARVRLLAWAER